MSEISPDEERIVTESGYIVDGNGEVVGHVGFPHDYVISKLEDVEAVLCKMQEQDGVITGLLARRKALLSNMDAIIAQEQGKRTWLDGRFNADLEKYAEANIDLSKKKSLDTPFGSIGYRKSVTKIIPNENLERLAVEWCWENGLRDAVKMEVYLKPLKGHENELPPEYFDIQWPRDVFGVSTGVSKSGGEKHEDS